MTTNKPTIDAIAIWQGYGYHHRKSESWDSLCRLRVWKPTETIPVIVIFSDLNEEDTGTSITNCSENLATMIKIRFNLEEPIRWFEHYPYHNTPEKLKKQVIFQESLSEIFYEWDTNDERYDQPRWKHIERTRVEDKVGCSLKMDGYKSLKKLQLQSPYEHKQEEFAKGKADAHYQNPRLYPPPTQAYLEGYRYGIEQLSDLN
ncbi:MAG: hypothetical protein AB4041_09720 [Microcystaceae cyanobacterium]